MHDITYGTSVDERAALIAQSVLELKIKLDHAVVEVERLGAELKAAQRAQWEAKASLDDALISYVREFGIDQSHVRAAEREAQPVDIETDR